MSAHSGCDGSRTRRTLGVLALTQAAEIAIGRHMLMPVIAASLAVVGWTAMTMARGEGDSLGFDAYVLGQDTMSTGDEGAYDTRVEDHIDSVDADQVPTSNAVAADSSPGGQGPRWDVAVDAIMLWQGNAQSLPLLLNTSGGVGYNAQDLQTQTGAGARVGLIRRVGATHAIEGNYFQARPFDATGTAPESDGPYKLTNTGDLLFSDIATATVATSGWIQSAEVNWRKQECWSPITWLVGFRWIELNSQTKVDYLFEDPSAGSGYIDSSAGNNLYGGQVGADMLFWNNGGSWRINGVGKAGIFYNAASYQRSSAGFVSAEGTTDPIGTVAAEADQTSFFGEVGLNSTYWITNWLAWRAGYTVMWAAGVAVAPQQLPLNNFGDGTATINTNSSVLLHGVTTGIEARW
jgi:hypothetical protein